METRVAVIAIIIEDGSAAQEVNELLHGAAKYIIGRMGIPYRDKGISIISIAIDAPQDVISTLSGKIGRLKGVSVKTAYSNVVSKRKWVCLGLEDIGWNGREIARYLQENSEEVKMIKIAVYGKGGIGKSTTVSNVAAALAEKGLKVMQIGCDPKADSTMQLRHGENVPTVLELVNQRKNDFELEDMVRIGFGGVVCVEAGGPTPGMGCAGRGIITALEKLKEKGAYEVYQPDVVLYDVLGDVVCGGFTMPMRKGYADKVFIVTSGENMSIHAAANIAMAIDNFKNRGYASLGGLILNRRNVKREDEKVAELADDFKTSVVGTLSRSEQVLLAEEKQQILLEAFPESEMADEYRKLADQILAVCEDKD